MVSEQVIQKVTDEVRDELLRNQQLLDLLDSGPDAMDPEWIAYVTQYIEGALSESKDDTRKQFRERAKRATVLCLASLLLFEIE